jgi:membrane protein
VPEPTAPTPALPGGVPHLVRTVERYVGRLGGEFAGGITYYSVLAVVPVLMFAFSAAGLVLTVTRPELLLPVADAVAAALGTADPAVRTQILGLVRGALSNWQGIGIVGLVTAVFAGAGWMGTLKNAVRAQWRPRFDVQGTGGNVVLLTLRTYGVNLLQLVALLLAMLVTFALASLSTTSAGTLLGLLGPDGSGGWGSLLLRLVSVVLSIGTGFVLFLFLYTVLPETREPASTVRRGALAGAVGLALLQYLATFLVGLFSGNRAIAVFGSVIALMLFLNLFAQLILIVAAWIATAHHPAAPAPAPAVVLEPPAPSVQAESVQADVVATPLQAAEARSGLLAGLLTGAGLGAVLGWCLARRRMLGP